MPLSRKEDRLVSRESNLFTCPYISVNEKQYAISKPRLRISNVPVYNICIRMCAFHNEPL